MFTRWILLFALANWRLASTDADYAHSTRENLLEDYGRTCPDDGIPVCGVRGKDYFLFPNQCLLDEVNIDISMGTRYFKKLPMKRCIHDCRLMCPKVYRPICGLNVHTQERRIFVSLCELTKYACKTNTDFMKLKITDCEPMEILTTSRKSLGKRSKSLNRKPVPCTGIFSPVCGTYLGVKSTFRNECLLNAENIKFGKDWRLVKRGICDEDYSKSQQHVNHKASKPHSIRKRSYDSRNYLQYEHSNTFMDYMSHLPSGYAPHMDMPPSMHPYSQIYTMPHIFQLPYQQVPYPAPTSFNSEDVINKIISMPPPDNNESAQEDDQEYEATDVNPMQFSINNMESAQEEDQQLEATGEKPMQFAMNNMNFNYMPARSSNHENAVQEPETSALDSYEENEVNRGNYYQTHPPSEPTYGNDELPEMEEKPEVNTTTDIPVTTTASPTEENVVNTPRDTTPESVTFEEVKQSLEEQSTKNSTACKFGETQICGVLSNGTVQTFETICEMMTRNIYLKDTWVKLHDGRCESCIFNCSREYKPICIQRNGVNYTMVNDCYFNMGICMDKISKWRKITDGECKRYTRIPDRYENIQAGFRYTSSYYVSSVTEKMLPSSTTEMPKSSTSNKISAADMSNQVEAIVGTNNNDPLEQSKQPNTTKVASSRVFSRRSNRSHNNPAFTNVPLSNGAPSKDSYIMNLVQSKGGLP